MLPKRSSDLLWRFPPVDYPIQQDEDRECYQNQNDGHDVPPFSNPIYGTSPAKLWSFGAYYLLYLQTVASVEKCNTGPVVISPAVAIRTAIVMCRASLHRAGAGRPCSALHLAALSGRATDRRETSGVPPRGVGDRRA